MRNPRPSLSPDAEWNKMYYTYLANKWKGKDAGPIVTSYATGTSAYLYELYPEAVNWSMLRKWDYIKSIELDSLSYGLLLVLYFFGAVIGMILMICIIASIF